MAWLLEMQAWVTVWEGTVTGMPIEQACGIEHAVVVVVVDGTPGQMTVVAVTDKQIAC